MEKGKKPAKKETLTSLRKEIKVLDKQAEVDRSIIASQKIVIEGYQDADDNNTALNAAEEDYRKLDLMYQAAIERLDKLAKELEGAKLSEKDNFGKFKSCHERLNDFNKLSWWGQFMYISGNDKV